MIESHIIKCDGPNCSQEKRAANHWFCIAKRDGQDSAFYCVPFESVPDANTPLFLHYCGQICVLKAFSEWLGKVAWNHTKITAKVSQ